MTVTWTKVPELKTCTDVAAYIGISEKQLYWLSRNVQTQYRKLELPKPDGTKRIVYAPSPLMKRVLRKLQSLFKLVEFPAHVGAYVLGKSCKHTAEQHIKSAEIVSIDLKDFFGSTTYGQVVLALKLSRKFTLPVYKLIATLVTLNGFVPQGSPTSGDVCNIVACQGMDRAIHLELLEFSRKRICVPNVEKFASIDASEIKEAVENKIKLETGGSIKRFFFKTVPKWTYTRYSDDIDLSCDTKLPKSIVNYLIYRVYERIVKSGFTVNGKKTKVERSGNRQVVLGMVVNEHTNVPVGRYKKYRAIIHNVLKNGYTAEMSRAGFDNPLKFHMHLQGVINYFGQINKAKKDNLADNLRAAKRLWKAELDPHQ